MEACNPWNRKPLRSAKNWTEGEPPKGPKDGRLDVWRYRAIYGWHGGSSMAVPPRHSSPPRHKRHMAQQALPQGARHTPQGCTTIVHCPASTLDTSALGSAGHRRDPLDGRAGRQRPQGCALRDLPCLALPTTPLGPLVPCPDSGFIGHTSVPQARCVATRNPRRSALPSALVTL